MVRCAGMHSSAARQRQRSSKAVLLVGPIVLLNPAPVSAAIAAVPHIDGAALGLAWGLPFVGIWLSIALMPLLAPKFWHHHFGKISAFWAVTFLIPLAVAFGARIALYEVLQTFLLVYEPFIVLLFALLVVAGGSEWSGTSSARQE